MKQIKIQVARGENFTPASLMKRYADQTGTEFRRSFWGAAERSLKAVSINTIIGASPQRMTLRPSPCTWRR